MFARTPYPDRHQPSATAATESGKPTMGNLWRCDDLPDEGRS